MSGCFLGLVASFLSLAAATQANAEPAKARIQPSCLRCEYLVNPLGIDVVEPRLSWTIAASDPAWRGERQTAYRILVAGSETALAADAGDLWDSGRVASDETVGVEYAGKPLTSRARCYWKIRVWDTDGRASAWSTPATWTMGLLEPDDWKGRWIGAHAAEGTDQFAAPLLRKTFAVQGTVVRATAYICGLGYNEFYINGRKIGDRVLDPGFTRYDRRILYVTHDVTHDVQSGQNAVGVMLGGGWYCLPTPDLFGNERSPWTAPPKLLFQLHIELSDGTTQTIVSDPTWKWATGEITFQCIRGGESHDMRQRKPNWNTTACNDADWPSVAVLPAPTGRLVAQKCPPIKTCGEVSAVELNEPKPGVFVFKFPETMAGWVRLSAHGSTGQKITLRLNETLLPDGTVDMKALTSHTLGRYQVGEMILDGSERQVYEPRFTYHGFQYVQVEGLKRRPVLQDLVGVRVHTALDSAGEFSCSDERLNSLHAMFRRTYLNNLHSVPTDCPTREKMGWLADGLMASEMAMWNFDAAAIYTKWIEDIFDLPPVEGSFAPSNGWNETNKDWTDVWYTAAAVMLPWQIYQHYGDRRILANQYLGMKRYVELYRQQAKADLLQTNIGDWLEVGSPDHWPHRTPKALTATAGYFQIVTILSRAAHLQGNRTDADAYAQLAERIRTAFNREFLDSSTGLYGADTQTGPAMALCFRLAPDDKKDLILNGLIENIAKKHDGHLSTGILGTRFLFDALRNAGRNDVACDVLLKKDSPGWMFMVDNGATTVWENWLPGLSADHPALCSPGAWLFTALAGIRPDPSWPGFKRIVIQPAMVGDLKWAKARYDSVHGPIVSEWSRENGRLSLSIAIPPNTTAMVHVPAKDADTVTEGGKPAAQATGVEFVEIEDGTAVFAVKSGHYCFVVNDKK